MKRIITLLVIGAILLLTASCANREQQPDIIATTMPVFTFTTALCSGTPLQVGQLISENISCLHDYTLTVKHMKMLENTALVVMSGGGLEEFLEDAIPGDIPVIDASENVHLHHMEETHSHEHHHDSDPHFWLSIKSAEQMTATIYQRLKDIYPMYSDQFNQNNDYLQNEFDKLHAYAKDNLSALSQRQIITFHDGFSYMAEEFGLTILKSIEEESGNEASAKDLIEICRLVNENALPAIFIEKNGSSSAASVIAQETGAQVFSLDMAISGEDYFSAMYYNINILKEALG